MAEIHPLVAKADDAMNEYNTLGSEHGVARFRVERALRQVIDCDDLTDDVRNAAGKLYRELLDES